VPARSRRPFDDGGNPDPSPPADAFDYALGVEGDRGAHYHVRVPDAGSPAAGLAGGAAARTVEVRVYRVEDCLDAAVAVRVAVASLGTGAEILDPEKAGTCSDAADHGGPGGSARPAPPVRVVRLRVPPGGVARVDEAVAKVPGLTPALSAVLKGRAAEEVCMDLHMVEGERRR
jgi:hypothetical protein